jgi:rRNA-processing protein FCF1
MCIIVDASCLHHVSNETECGQPVIRWLLNPKKAAGLIVGGQLYAELRRSSFEREKKERFFGFLTELSRAGRLHKFIGPEIYEKTEEVKRTGIRSNDPHIIALAMISKCNVVFAQDTELEKDLKNRPLVGHKVSIYKNETHARLLTTCRCRNLEQR